MAAKKPSGGSAKTAASKPSKARKAPARKSAAAPADARSRPSGGRRGRSAGKNPGTPRQLVAGKPDGVADEMANDLRKLQMEQNALRAVELVLAGASTDQIAADMEVDASTVRRWLRMPGAQAAIAEAHVAQVRRVVHMSGTAASAAVTTLMRAMREAPKWSDKIRAAEALMRAFGMSQMTEAVAETGRAHAEARSELAATLSQMAERARSTVIEVGVVEPTPDVGDDEGEGRAALAAVD